MAVIGSSIAGGKISIAGSAIPTIYNVPIALPNTEYSQVLSNDTTQIMVRARIGSTIKLAFTAGQSGTNYITIPAGASLHEKDLRLVGATLYFQLSAADTVEILEWT